MLTTTQEIELRLLLTACYPHIYLLLIRGGYSPPRALTILRRAYFGNRAALNQIRNLHAKRPHP